MALDKLQFKITKGMNQDLSKEVFSPEVAYSLLNIKNQISDDNNSVGALTNEKGTKLTHLYYNNENNLELGGEVLGVVKCLANVVVVFIKHQGKDLIYRIDYDPTQDNATDHVVVKKLAEGYFNFGNKIKGIFCFENSEIQKVYWVDGVNQLRYINIADSNFKSETNPEGKLPITNEIYINSSPEFKLGHKIKVERVTGGGIFTAGVIQYAFTYYMKYGAETGIVDMTPLYYISEKERGLMADETVGCSFKVSIENPDTRFDYLRIYSIQRTSLNGTPIVKIVKDLKLR